MTRIDRADNAKFIEQFRYTIVASQLLSGHSILGQNRSHDRVEGPTAVSLEGDTDNNWSRGIGSGGSDGSMDG